VARGHGGGGLEASCYPTHPESNGRIERFHRSTREALDDQDLRTWAGRARSSGRWVEFYNTRRLHAGLKYLAPAEYWAGDPATRFEEQNEKLKQARECPEITNRKRLQEAA
jgi:hypothetical protein